MNISFIVFVIALVLVVIFFKDFNAFVYFVVMTDVFLRIVTYLKINIIKDTAFGFLKLIPADVPSIIRAFDFGVFTEILLLIYVIVYIIFEGLLIRTFVRRKF